MCGIVVADAKKTYPLMHYTYYFFIGDGVFHVEQLDNRINKTFVIIVFICCIIIIYSVNVLFTLYLCDGDG